MKESIIYKGEKFIRGDICGLGVPDFPEYKNTTSKDWFWAENSAKLDNRFLWKDVSENESKKWK